MNLVETTWLTRYPIPIKITYDQGSEFISHEFIKYLIKTEYGITVKPITSGNTTPNAILEWIHQVLGNLVWTFNISKTYVDEDDPWLVILAAAAFGICSTENGLKGYSPVKLSFGRDMILPIKHKVGWELMHHQNQTKVNKDNICKNSKKLTTTTKLEIRSFSLITLHTNIKRHTTVHL